MKHTAFSRLITLLLTLTLLLGVTACAGNGTQPPVQSGDNTAPPTDTPTEAPTEAPAPSDPVISPYYVSEHLYPEELITLIKQKLKTSRFDFAELSFINTPYVLQDGEFISNGRVRSVSFPVARTKLIDSKGNLQFTLRVYRKDFTGLGKLPLKTVTIQVNAAEFELNANDTPMKWITLDLSSQNLVLAKNETLAFYIDTDTIIPAFTESKELRGEINRYCKNASGYLDRIGTSSVRINQSCLLFDVEMERTYESDVVYKALQAEIAAHESELAALKAKYAGKRISILGDSISTYGGISNNTSYNTTIGSNAVYYQDNGQLSGSAHTYWGHVIDMLGMELCVNNSWSGSRVFGKAEASYKDTSITRAKQLHDDNGTPNDPSDDILPDVIIFYMGINDTPNTPFGTDPTSYDKTSLDTWFQRTLNKTQNGTNCKPAQTYSSLEQAYALTLYNMKQAYPNAEIYCINLIPHIGLHRTNPTAVPKRNEFIKAITDYFDVTLVNQYEDSGIEILESAHFFMLDNDQLHPNAGGHERIGELIVETILKKNKQ